MTDLSKLLKELPEKFLSSERYQSALTHKSHYVENKESVLHYERLEFLGDAALGLVVAKVLFSSFQKKDEGFLTKARSNLVNTKILSQKAKELRLDEKIQTGRSEKSVDGVWQPRILASALEALMGAMYLELGEETLTEFILKVFEEEFHSEEKLLSHSSDWKSKLQEELQKEFQKTPNYEVVSTQGPDHQRSFSVQVNFEGEVLGQGEGLSRKEAEQEAAKQALKRREEKNGNG